MTFPQGLRLTHLITGLTTGGAETMLLKLCRVWAGQGVQLEVISMIAGGALAPRFRDLGIPVLELGMRPGVPGPMPLGRLVARLATHRPQVFQTWMYHADLMGGLAAQLLGKPFPVLWNIRASLDPSTTKRASRLVAHACARMSGTWPDRIVCCSERAAEVHREFGYASARMRVLPNGFELDRFRADPAAAAAIRLELGLGPHVRLLGQVARFDHPIKGHFPLLDAMGRLAGEPHLLLSGDAVESTNTVLAAEIRRLGLTDRVHLLGRRQDVPRIMAGLDFLVSPSISEGFPNVVGEAMACETPCIVTDVGDSAFIVGDHGWVVPPGDPAALAGILREALALPEGMRREMGGRARARVEELFDIRGVADRYLAEYAALLEHPGL